MNCNCRHIQTELALFAGQDLDEAASEPIRQHIAGCCSCAAQWEALQCSLSILHEVKSASAEPVGSVWMRLQPRLQRCQPPMEGTRFNGWVPALAVLTACVLIVVFSDPGPQPIERRTVIGVHAAGAPALNARPVPVRREMYGNPDAELQRWVQAQQQRREPEHRPMVVMPVMDDMEGF